MLKYNYICKVKENIVILESLDNTKFYVLKKALITSSSIFKKFLEKETISFVDKIIKLNIETTILAQIVKYCNYNFTHYNELNLKWIQKYCVYNKNILLDLLRVAKQLKIKSLIGIIVSFLNRNENT